MPPTRVSFVAALTVIENAFADVGHRARGPPPERLARLRADLEHFILPERRNRSYPRALKTKMSNYPRKHPAGASSRSRAR